MRRRMDHLAIDRSERPGRNRRPGGSKNRISLIMGELKRRTRQNAGRIATAA